MNFSKPAFYLTAFQNGDIALLDSPCQDKDWVHSVPVSENDIRSSLLVMAYADGLVAVVKLKDALQHKLKFVNVRYSDACRPIPGSCSGLRAWLAGFYVAPAHHQLLLRTKSDCCDCYGTVNVSLSDLPRSSGKSLAVRGRNPLNYASCLVDEDETVVGYRVVPPWQGERIVWGGLRKYLRNN